MCEWIGYLVTNVPNSDCRWCCWRWLSHCRLGPACMSGPFELWGWSAAAGSHRAPLLLPQIVTSTNTEWQGIKGTSGAEWGCDCSCWGWLCGHPPLAWFLWRARLPPWRNGSNKLVQIRATLNDRAGQIHMPEVMHNTPPTPPAAVWSWASCDTGHLVGWAELLYIFTGELWLEGCQLVLLRLCCLFVRQNLAAQKRT